MYMYACMGACACVSVGALWKPGEMFDPLELELHVDVGIGN